MNTKKSVCFFVREFPVLSETFVLNQVLEIAKSGFDVRVLSVNPITQDDRVKNNVFSQNNIKVDLIPIFTKKHDKSSFIQMFLGFLYCLFSIERLGLLKLFFSFLKKKNFFIARDLLCLVWNVRKLNISMDSCIAHFGNNGVVFDHLVKAKLIQCSHLFTIFHGFEISKYDQIRSWGNLYKTLSGTILPISELWSFKLQKLGVSKDKIEVIHMGVDIDRFSFKERDIGRVPSILTVARATEKKGLVYAIEGVLNCDLDCELKVIGDGMLLPDLKAIALNHKNAHRVKFLGSRPSDFVVDALDNSDIFLLPSVVDINGDMEGIPVSLMEAMAKGVLVLSTYHSGIPELIKDGLNGYLVQERDSVGISKKLESIIRDCEYKSLTIKARQTIEVDFNAKKLNERLCQLILS
ncbi:glycosyltransferase [Alteromonas stellipolaris]|uniref:glycosyltransferase n=1 Tax=Alteromonas stellipolaris TaxID=233316 RepID=UPI002734BA08|nr:glycosyltransferase [Alteromonas stellipolaris]MDP2537245.1 glycosyltransferase [Alteromonas stellipolaris]